AEAIHEKGITVAGIVGKFSVRNPAHELQIADWIKKEFSYVALGHHVSGDLNFPRRIATTYLNAALHRVHESFMRALNGILYGESRRAPRYLLKPDGGTIDLESTVYSPSATAQSGPAASVMGALALDGCGGTALVLDVGGTTTDMSVVLQGVPLLEPRGIRIGQFQTLVRSLLTHSVGIGGDSAVRLGADGSLQVGPHRQGPPMAFGGRVPTPTDAMIALGDCPQRLWRSVSLKPWAVPSPMLQTPFWRGSIPGLSTPFMKSFTRNGLFLIPGWLLAGRHRR
ncbi:MAG: hydantoinase/oxoprolinase family protein, partial [Deltaproteobacteria bacterium]